MMGTVPNTTSVANLGTSLAWPNRHLCRDTQPWPISYSRLGTRSGDAQRLVVGWGRAGDFRCCSRRCSRADIGDSLI